MATVMVDLPVSFFDTGGSENTIGNPAIGILFNQKGPAFAEASVRIPLMPDYMNAAGFNGWQSDFSRQGAFLSDYVTLRARIGGRVTSQSGRLLARLSGGPTILAPTDGDDTELLVDVVGQLWLEADQYMLGTTLSSRTIVTNDPFDLGEDSEFLLGVGASRTFGNVRPGLHAHLPLASGGIAAVGDYVDFIFGFNVTVFLGQTEYSQE
jgi:hypothetical protein